MRYAEKDFLQLLDSREIEQQTWKNGWGAFTPLAQQLSGWLGIHPWRVLIPASCLLVLGSAYVLRDWLLILVGWMQSGW